MQTAKQTFFHLLIVYIASKVLIHRLEDDLFSHQPSHSHDPIILVFQTNDLLFGDIY